MKNIKEKRLALFAALPIIILVLVLFLRFKNTSEINIVGKWKTKDGNTVFVFDESGYLDIYTKYKNKTTKIQGDEWKVTNNQTLGYYTYHTILNTHHYYNDSFGTENYHTKDYVRKFAWWKITSDTENTLSFKGTDGQGNYTLYRVIEKE